MSHEKVLVTGGTGLLGMAVQGIAQQPKTAHCGRNVLCDAEWIFLGSKDGDLKDLQATRALFQQHRPTHVLHLAARVGGLFKNLRSPVEMWHHNTAINNNVLKCCHECGVTKVVACLSTCIFPDKTSYPITEQMLHEGPPHPSNSAYAYSKRMLDTLIRAYRDEYGCHYCTVVPTNLYGPHDQFNLEDAHVVPALIHKCWLAKQAGHSLVVSGSGKPVRQFVYSEDLAMLLVWALQAYDEAEPIILAGDPTDEVSIADLARTIAKYMDFEGPLRFDCDKADGQFRKTASNSKLRRYLPDFHFTPMEEGIRRSVEWFITHYDVVRK